MTKLTLRFFTETGECERIVEQFIELNHYKQNSLIYADSQEAILYDRETKVIIFRTETIKEAYDKIKG